MSTRLQPASTTRIRHFVLVRGLVTAAAALTALRWPDTTLIIALGATGLLFAVFGALEAAIAWQVRARRTLFRLLVGDGCSAIVLGALTLLLPSLPLALDVVLVVAWFVLYGAAVLLAWNVLLRDHLAAPAVLGWGAANLLLALFAVFHRWTNVLTLLYAGAGYAAVFSLAAVGAAVWIALWRAGGDTDRSTAASSTPAVR